MQIGRPGESRETIDRAFVNLQLGFTDCLSLSSRNNKRLCRVAGPRHLHKTVIVSVGSGQLNIEVIAVWKCANGLRRNKNTFWESRHGSPHWNIAKWFCK